ncbi:hypothetical protein [Achromobacter xylosoxidans]|uniref:hypothetical protein n=1 Tax=Alcaligenes xylosoxydans xylosoxydans TaxID=85698 RepID=UPI001F13C4DC|nr:hypothetical protein [Achromobacter xylosoxidans]
MTFSLSQLDADQIDQAMIRLYPRLGGQELSQLAKLFDGKFLQDLENLLKQRLPPNIADRQLSVDIAWIDKRPYSLMQGETSRVELADAAFFYFDLLSWPTHKTFRDCRGLLLQAKAAKTEDQLRSPSVCINPPLPKPNTTTDREFRLLSTWPIFDLYASSSPKDKYPLASNLQVEVPKSGPPPHGWFIATPGRRPNSTQKNAWRSPWMCAPAALSHPCVETLGSLIAGFLSDGAIPNKSTELPAAGAKFTFEPDELTTATPKSQGWDRVCLEILRAIDGKDIPPHLTGGSTTKRRQTINLNALPLFPAMYSVLQAIVDGCLRRANRRMPVLIVSHVIHERTR